MWKHRHRQFHPEFDRGCAVKRWAVLKLAAMRVIGEVGGIKGGVQATGLSKTTVGNWNNRNDERLPSIENCIALDEAALLCGGRPAMIEAAARELGMIAVRIPEIDDPETPAVPVNPFALAQLLADASGAMATALDGVSVNITVAQAAGKSDEIDAAIARLVQLRVLLNSAAEDGE